jgi:hypothetical protein
MRDGIRRWKQTLRQEGTSKKASVLVANSGDQEA